MSNVLNKLRERVVKRKQDCKDRLIDSISKHGIQVDASEYQFELVMLNKFLRWIDELSATSDEQTQPGLLPCPFCGAEEVECVCVSNSHAYATVIVCSQCNIEFFHRYGKHQEAWNTRANKTQ